MFFSSLPRLRGRGSPRGAPPESGLFCPLATSNQREKHRHAHKPEDPPKGPPESGLLLPPTTKKEKKQRILSYKLFLFNQIYPGSCIVCRHVRNHSGRLIILFNVSRDSAPIPPAKTHQTRFASTIFVPVCFPRVHHILIWGVSVWRWVVCVRLAAPLLPDPGPGQPAGVRLAAGFGASLRPGQSLPVIIAS